MMTVEPYLPTWGGDEVLLSGRDKESAVQDGRRPLMMEARRGFRAGEMKKKRQSVEWEVEEEEEVE